MTEVSLSDVAMRDHCADLSNSATNYLDAAAWRKRYYEWDAYLRRQEKAVVGLPPLVSLVKSYR